jgi:hypothetical protein
MLSETINEQGLPVSAKTSSLVETPVAETSTIRTQDRAGEPLYALRCSGMTGNDVSIE